MKCTSRILTSHFTFSLGNPGQITPIDPIARPRAFDFAQGASDAVGCHLRKVKSAEPPDGLDGRILVRITQRKSQVRTQNARLGLHFRNYFFVGRSSAKKVRRESALARKRAGKKFRRGGLAILFPSTFQNATHLLGNIKRSPQIIKTDFPAVYQAADLRIAEQ